MKKLFYTLFLALFALNLSAYTTYYAFTKTSGFDLTTTENFTYLSTSIYNIYVFEHTNAITITVKNGSREMPINLGAEDATYIDTKKQQNPIFYDFYILTDFEGDISDKVTPEDPYYIEDFTLVNSIGKYKQYKSRFNTSIFGASIYIQSPNSTWFFAQEVNYNGKIMFYDKQTEELSVVGELEYKNNQFPPIQDAFFSKITYTAENYNIDYFQWVSCPYDAELTVHVGTTKAIYTYDGNLADDGTEPAFVLMRYENDKEIPWVDNGSATLERGVGYILGIDRRLTSGQVVAEYESINDINTMEETCSHTLSKINGILSNGNDANIHLIGSGLFASPSRCSFGNTGILFLATPEASGGYTYGRIYSDKVNLNSNLSKLTPHKAFFVQTTGNLTFDNNGISQSAPSLKRAIEQQFIIEEYNITLTGADFEEKTTILTNELGTEGYTIGEDFLYFHSSPNGDVANQFYSFDANSTLSFNHRANTTQTIRLGGQVAQDGRYTISLDGVNTKATSVILTDNVENTFVDLINENYTFDAHKGSISGRFTVTINYAPNTTVDNDVVTNSNGIVVVNNFEGCTIENLVAGEQMMIFDAMGRLVYNAPADANSVNLTLSAGTYIVRQNNNWAKFVIK